MGRVRRRIEADARVDALSTAEVRALPQIVDQLGADRALVRDRLHALLDGGGTVRRPARRGAWRCCPTNPPQARFLFDRLVTARVHARGGPGDPRGPAAHRRAGAVRRAGDRGPPPAVGAARRRRAMRRLGLLAVARPGWEPMAGIRRADRRQARAASIPPSSPPGGGSSSRSAAALEGPSAGDLRRAIEREPRAWRSRCCWNSPRSRTGPTGPRPWPACWPTRTRTSSGRSSAACPRARIGPGPSR